MTSSEFPPTVVRQNGVTSAKPTDENHSPPLTRGNAVFQALANFDADFVAALEPDQALMQERVW